MIVSKNGTSYDTADGSQQPDEKSAEGLRRSERELINRWEDDGPGPHAHTVPPAVDSPRQPAWSVLSLTNLLDAIRELRDEPSDAAKRHQRERAERGRFAAELDRQDRAAAAAHAHHHRARNAWENT